MDTLATVVDGLEVLLLPAPLCYGEPSQARPLRMFSGAATFPTGTFYFKAVTVDRDE